MLNVEIVKIDASTRKAQETTDCVAEEKPVHILINRKHYATIYCSPSNLKELAIGHLLSEGIIRSPDEIEETDLKTQGVCKVRLKPSISLEKRLKASGSHMRVILSACGRGSPFQPLRKLPKIKSGLTVQAGVVLACANRLNSIAGIFRKTGGVHAAAVYKGDGTLMAFAEDVGRHNAVDKAIGIAVLNRISLDECLLALSGRVTGDIVAKAAMVGLPIVASLSAAIDSGVTLSKEAGATLVGFVRGKRMNVYAGSERILI
jgi:FdhD protein